MIGGPIGHWLIRFYEFQKFKLILRRPETDNKTHFVAAKHSDRRKELVEDDHITRSTGTYTNRGNELGTPRVEILRVSLSSLRFVVRLGAPFRLQFRRM